MHCLYLITMTTQKTTARTQLSERLQPICSKAAKDYELDESLIYAVIRTESGFNADAQSDAGACGIMQVMPSSFEWSQRGKRL